MSKVKRHVFVRSTAFILYEYSSQSAARSYHYSPPHHWADPSPIVGKPASQATGDKGLLGPDSMS